MDHGNALPAHDAVSDLGFEHNADGKVDRVTFALAASTERHAGSGDGECVQAAHVALRMRHDRALDAGRR